MQVLERFKRVMSSSFHFWNKMSIQPQYLTTRTHSYLHKYVQIMNMQHNVAIIYWVGLAAFLQVPRGHSIKSNFNCMLGIWWEMQTQFAFIIVYIWRRRFFFRFCNTLLVKCQEYRFIKLYIKKHLCLYIVLQNKR